MAKTENLNLDLSSIIGAGPNMREAVKDNFQKIDDFAGDVAGKGAAVADATDDTDVVDRFNDLLASLRAAGVIAT